MSLHFSGFFSNFSLLDPEPQLNADPDPGGNPQPCSFLSILISHLFKPLEELKVVLEFALDQLVHGDNLVHVHLLEGGLQHLEVVDVLVLQLCVEFHLQKCFCNISTRLENKSKSHRILILPAVRPAEFMSNPISGYLIAGYWISGRISSRFSNLYSPQTKNLSRNIHLSNPTKLPVLVCPTQFP